MIGITARRGKARRAALAGMTFLGAFLIGSSLGLAAERSAELKEIIKLARDEGRVQVVGTQFGAAEGVRPAEAGIRKMFDAKIAIEFAPGPAMAVMAAKLNEEFQAGRKASTDIFAATAIQLGPYQDKGLFRKIAWTQLMPGRIKPNLVESDGRALRVETQTPGILYNVKAAPWVKDIKVMADLLKPEYRGKFVTTPYLAGFDVLAAKGGWGPDKTIDYIRKFSKQVSGFINCASESRIASGEVPALALDCVGGAPNTLRYRNVLNVHIVSDVAQRRYTYLAIPSNASHPYAAVLYALYLVSPEGQRDVAANLDGADLDDFPDSVVRRRTSALEAQGVKFTNVTFDWWQKNAREVEGPMREMVKLVR